MISTTGRGDAQRNVRPARPQVGRPDEAAREGLNLSKVAGVQHFFFTEEETKLAKARMAKKAKIEAKTP